MSTYKCIRAYSDTTIGTIVSPVTGESNTTMYCDKDGKMYVARSIENFPAYWTKLA